MKIYIKPKRKDNKYPVSFRFSNCVTRNKLLTLAQVNQLETEYPGAEIIGKARRVNPKKKAAKKRVRKNPSAAMYTMARKDLQRYKKAGYLMTAAKREVKALRRDKDWARVVDIQAAAMLWSAPKKKVTMRKAPAVVDHLITSTKRKRDAGDTKETKMVWFWEGIGWTTDTDKAARYHDPNQAQKIALLIVDNPKLHNANRRQMAVIEDAQHPQGELRSKRGSPGGK